MILLRRLLARLASVRRSPNKSQPASEAYSSWLAIPGDVSVVIAELRYPSPQGLGQEVPWRPEAFRQREREQERAFGLGMKTSLGRLLSKSGSGFDLVEST